MHQKRQRRVFAIDACIYLICQSTETTQDPYDGESQNLVRPELKAAISTSMPPMVRFHGLLSK